MTIILTSICNQHPNFRTTFIALATLVLEYGALIRIGALINKNTFEGGRLFGRGAYWKESAKSDQYGKTYYMASSASGQDDPNRAM